MEALVYGAAAAQAGRVARAVAQAAWELNMPLVCVQGRKFPPMCAVHNLIVAGRSGSPWTQHLLLEKAGGVLMPGADAVTSYKCHGHLQCVNLQGCGRVRHGRV
jgi:hypothetical protein